MNLLCCSTDHQHPMAAFRKGALLFLAFLLLARIQGFSCSTTGRSARNYIKVDDDGNVTFSYHSSFSPSMSECSMEAYFESYSRVVNFSLFDLAAFTTDDTEPCEMSLWYIPSAFSGTPHRVRGGQITFSSSDKEFVGESGRSWSPWSDFCFRLLTFPYTYMLVRAESVQNWVESDLYIRVYNRRQGIRDHSVSISSDEIVQGVEKRIAGNDTVLKVAGLHNALVGHPGRHLTLTFRSVPWCTRPGLEVKHPTHNTTGWSLCLSRVYCVCILCVSTTSVTSFGFSAV